MAAMYAVYHGPEGLKTISQRVHGLAGAFAVGLKKLGTVEVQSLPFFDTVKVKVADAHAISDAATKLGLNLRVVDSSTVSFFFVSCISYLTKYSLRTEDGVFLHHEGTECLLLFRSLFRLMKQLPWRMLTSFSKLLHWESL